MGSISAPLEAKRPLVGVGVFVFRSRTDKRFVFGVRKGSYGSGTWSLPGGHLEYGETFEQCAKRETMEEIGMEIEDVEFVTATESMFIAEAKQYVTIFMSAYAKVGEDGKVPEPQLLEPDKCEGWHWKTIQELREVEERPGPWPLFEPMKNLMTQRPYACTALEEIQEQWRQESKNT